MANVRLIGFEAGFDPVEKRPGINALQPETGQRPQEMRASGGNINRCWYPDDPA
jgi:hypothetical protein